MCRYHFQRKIVFFQHTVVLPKNRICGGLYLTCVSRCNYDSGSKEVLVWSSSLDRTLNCVLKKETLSVHSAEYQMISAACEPSLKAKAFMWSFNKPKMFPWTEIYKQWRRFYCGRGLKRPLFFWPGGDHLLLLIRLCRCCCCYKTEPLMGSQC